MSDDLHPTIYRWDGRRLLAQHEGVRVVQNHPPEGLKYDYLHFEPALQVFECRDRAVDARRDLEAEERSAAMGALRRMAASARGAL